MIPPHLHLRTLNPHMSRSAREIAISVESTRWPESARHVAGVSSFGFAGTNAHVVLASADDRVAESESRRPFDLLTLSAPSQAALQVLASDWARDLRELSPDEWASACATSTAGRAHFSHRLAVVAADPQEAAARLVDPARGPTVFRGTRGAAATPVCFLFTGQGAVFPQMGRTLYETQPVFRAALDRCDSWLRTHADLPLLDRMYGPAATQAALTATSCAQPAIFSMQFALAEMWRSWGVVADTVIGHSVGEFAAAWIAGVPGGGGSAEPGRGAWTSAAVSARGRSNGERAGE